MQQFQRWAYSLDISGIQEYPISRVKHQGQRPSLVIVLYYIFLYLPNCGLDLFNCHLYLLHELVYCFQSRRALPRFKAHMEGLSSIKQEQSLLGRGIHVVVVLEFHHQQQVMPVILLLIDEQTQILVELLIDMLCLSVSLQMPGYKGGQLNPQQSIKFFCKQSYKLRSTV